VWFKTGSCGAVESNYKVALAGVNAATNKSLDIFAQVETPPQFARLVR
jgi:hypothetical protein